jgi:hypothetical protein
MTLAPVRGSIRRSASLTLKISRSGSRHTRLIAIDVQHGDAAALRAGLKLMFGR